MTSALVEIIWSALLWALGLLMWYFIYGFEIVLNGGSPNVVDLLRYAAQEFTWILPGGYDRKLRYVRRGVRDEPLLVTETDRYLADSLPGPMHFVFTHVLLPGGPWLIYLLLT